uniref:Ancient ubiquitous protein 1-like isoform X2 n=1 Tax=Dermatophagoides pteronyssinus TaxID=6956 RepID=A0A6P6YGT4_DERPT|nr:ancient ubiquitous protein 1-like isoform X2 [Dermatophagoides pteronyssinus]
MSSSVKQSNEESSPTESAECSTTTTNQSNKPNYSIDKLFDLKRIKSKQHYYWLILYSPFGLCLFIIRFFIFLYVLFVSAILPHSSSVRRSLFFILGISINTDVDDDDYYRKLKAKFLIANHISDLDPVILNLIMPCASYVGGNNGQTSNQPCYLQWLCQILKPNDGDNVYELSMKNVPIVCFPEQSKTNGRFGLFKFISNLYHHDSLVHMIFLETKRPIFNVSISPLGSHWLADLFWIFFLPVTIFKVKHLGKLEKEESETYEEFLQRIQSVMANKTGLQATDFRWNDKREFIKRLLKENQIKKSSKSNPKQKQQQTNSQKESKINDYSKKVKEILPQVPLDVIKADILITNNIDDTVERILNGIVKFIPEKQQQSSSVDEKLLLDKDVPSTSSITSNDIKIPVVDNKNFGAKTFGKTSTERISSFQERKAQMYRMARIRYLQKRGLLNANFLQKI